jgi:hypothetical protein
MFDLNLVQNDFLYQIEGSVLYKLVVCIHVILESNYEFV